MPQTKYFIDKIVQPASVEVTITPSAAPDAGTFTLEANGVETAVLDFDATAAEIKAAIQDALDLTYGVDVVGTMATTVVVTVQGMELILIEGDTNDMTATAVPVTLEFAPVHDWTIDAREFIHCAIEVTYDANAGDDMTVGFSCSGDLFEVDTNLTATQDVSGGVHIFSLENVFPRYIQLTIPEDSAPVIRLQGMRFGVA